VPEALHRAATRAYRGPIADKLALLSSYRFGLAIENTRFPGYVSEKLFDCFFAGCIPVYDGAPDIHTYVPSEAFVDVRHFSGYADLDAFLRSMPQPTAERYLDAARAYLDSAQFSPFCAQEFAEQIIQALVAA
jgi:alpha(1,3/1,4) fucosyltransferase